MIQIVVRGVRKIFQSHVWRRAFADVGALGSQDAVAGTLKVELDWEALPDMSRERPGIREVDLCLLRGVKLSAASHTSCMPAVGSSAGAIAEGGPGVG